MEAPADPTLRLIAIFKLAKGLLLLLLAFGIFRLLHQDLRTAVEHWLGLLRVDPENKYSAALLSKAGLLNQKSLGLLSGFTFVYSALFLTEGLGRISLLRPVSLKVPTLLSTGLGPVGFEAPRWRAPA